MLTSNLGLLAFDGLVMVACLVALLFDARAGKL